MNEAVHISTLHVNWIVWHNVPVLFLSVTAAVSSL